MLNTLVISRLSVSFFFSAVNNNDSFSGGVDKLYNLKNDDELGWQSLGNADACKKIGSKIKR